MVRDHAHRNLFCYLSFRYMYICRCFYQRLFIFMCTYEKFKYFLPLFLSLSDGGINSLNSQQEWFTEWALKWVEHSILSYTNGETSLNILLGRIRRAMERYGIKRGNVLAIIELLQKNPVYLPLLSEEERSSKLRPLKKMLSARALE